MKKKFSVFFVAFAILFLGCQVNCLAADSNDATKKLIGLINSHLSESHLAEVKSLISQGANIDTVDVNQNTLLLVASDKGLYEITKLLLESGAQADKSDKNGLTPLIIACQNGYVEIVKTLIENGADVNKTDLKDVSPLFIACQEGNVELVKLLLPHGADVNVARSDGATPLFAASAEGHISIVRLLIDNSARVNKEKNDGGTPIIIASMLGHLEIVQLLIENNAQVNIARNDGVTPLFAACLQGHADIVETLLKRQADMNVRIQNYTPKSIAEKRGHKNIVKILNEYENSKPISNSMSKKDIIKIQQKLISLGYNPGPADGFAGAKTRSAVQSFQKAYGLKITGEADAVTARKLFSVKDMILPNKMEVSKEIFQYGQIISDFIHAGLESQSEGNILVSKENPLIITCDEGGAKRTESYEYKHNNVTVLFDAYIFQRLTYSVNYGDNDAKDGVWVEVVPDKVKRKIVNGFVSFNGIMKYQEKQIKFIGEIRKIGVSEVTFSPGTICKIDSKQFMFKDGVWRIYQ